MSNYFGKGSTITAALGLLSAGSIVYASPIKKCCSKRNDVYILKWKSPAHFDEYKQSFNSSLYKLFGRSVHNLEEGIGEVCLALIECCLKTFASFFNYIAHETSFSLREKNIIYIKSASNIAANSSQTSTKVVDIEEKWEEVYEDQNIKVFRRPLDSINGIYKYKCTGTYNDITPLNFVKTQNDLEYRKKWDENVITLEQVEEDVESDFQIINWIVKFPYPMYARQYIYLRKMSVDEETNRIVVDSKALDDKEYPDSGKYVRVVRYMSKLIVDAHTKLNEKGLDYILVYYDDPRSNIPRGAYNWIVNRGGPYFMQKIHEAAKTRENSERRESD